MVVTTKDSSGSPLIFRFDLFPVSIKRILASFTDPHVVPNLFEEC